MIVFWAAIAGGAVVAYAGLKKGFLPIWAACFNVLVSIYLGVMLLPVMAAVIPDRGTQEWFYMCAASMLVIALLVFSLLQTVASAYFSGGYAISFPKIMDWAIAPALGFVCGYVALSFVLLVTGLMPFSSHRHVRGILDERALPPAVRNAVTGACNVIGAASVQIYPRKAKDVLEDFAKQRNDFVDARDNEGRTAAGYESLPAARFAEATVL